MNIKYLLWHWILDFFAEKNDGVLGKYARYFWYFRARDVQNAIKFSAYFSEIPLGLASIYNV